MQARRSARPRKQIDYNEDNLLPQHKALATVPINYQHYSQLLLQSRQDASSCIVTSAGSLSAADLLSSGFKQPVLLQPVGSQADTIAALQMQLPIGFTLEWLRQQLGEQHQVPVIDVATQEAQPHMSLGQWVSYMCSAKRSSQPLLNVLSLTLAGTAAEQQVSAPAMVHQLDLATQVLPASSSSKQQQQQQPQQSQGAGSISQYSRKPLSALLYTLCSPAGCYTDWHIDFGGSAVWYHIKEGVKVFLVAPPTPANLAAYESWAGSDSQAQRWLGSDLQGCERVTLGPGTTFLLPPGWPHAVVTLETSLAVGGNFLCSAHLPTHLAIYAMEQRLKVHSSCLYPGFKQLMWHTAVHFLQQSDILRGDRMTQEAKLRGVQGLIEALQQWLQPAIEMQQAGTLSDGVNAAAAGVPDEIADPAGLLQQLRQTYGPVAAASTPSKRAPSPVHHSRSLPLPYPILANANWQKPAQRQTAQRQTAQQIPSAAGDNFIVGAAAQFVSHAGIGAVANSHADDNMLDDMDDLLFNVPMSPLSAGALASGSGMHPLLDGWPGLGGTNNALAEIVAKPGRASAINGIRPPTANPAAGLFNWMRQQSNSGGPVKQLQQPNDARRPSITGVKRSRSVTDYSGDAGDDPEQNKGNDVLDMSDDEQPYDPHESSGGDTSSEGAGGGSGSDSSHDWDPSGHKKDSRKTGRKPASTKSSKHDKRRPSIERQRSQSEYQAQQQNDMHWNQSSGSNRTARQQQTQQAIRDDGIYALTNGGQQHSHRKLSRLKHPAGDGTERQLRRRQQWQNAGVASALAAAAAAAGSKEFRRQRLEQTTQQQQEHPSSQQQQQPDSTIGIGRHRHQQQLQPRVKQQLEHPRQQPQQPQQLSKRQQQRKKQEQLQHKQELALAKGAELARPLSQLKRPNAPSRAGTSKAASPTAASAAGTSSASKATAAPAAGAGQGQTSSASGIPRNTAIRQVHVAAKATNAASNDGRRLADALDACLADSVGGPSGSGLGQSKRPAAAGASATAPAASKPQHGSRDSRRDIMQRHSRHQEGRYAAAHHHHQQQQQRHTTCKDRSGRDCQHDLDRSRSRDRARSTQQVRAGGSNIVTVAGLLSAANKQPGNAAAGRDLLGRLQQVLHKEKRLQQMIRSGGAMLKDGGVRLQRQIEALEAAVARVSTQVKELIAAEEAAATAAVVTADCMHEQAHAAAGGDNVGVVDRLLTGMADNSWESQHEQQVLGGHRDEEQQLQHNSRHNNHGPWQYNRDCQQANGWDRSGSANSRQRDPWDTPADGEVGGRMSGQYAGAGAAEAAAAVQQLTEQAMAQISEEAAAAAVAADAAVTDPIWFFIPPGKGRKELGPFSVRDLYDHLTRGRLPPTQLVTDDAGELTLPLYVVIEPHNEYLHSSSNLAWQQQLQQQQVQREQVVLLTRKQLEERERQQQERQQQQEGEGGTPVKDADGYEGRVDDDDKFGGSGGGGAAVSAAGGGGSTPAHDKQFQSPYDAFWDYDEFAAEPAEDEGEQHDQENQQQEQQQQQLQQGDQSQLAFRAAADGQQPAGTSKDRQHQTEQHAIIQARQVLQQQMQAATCIPGLQSNPAVRQRQQQQEQQQTQQDEDQLQHKQFTLQPLAIPAGWHQLIADADGFTALGSNQEAQDTVMQPATAAAPQGMAGQPLRLGFAAPSAARAKHIAGPATQAAAPDIDSGSTNGVAAAAADSQSAASAVVQAGQQLAGDNSSRRDAGAAPWLPPLPPSPILSSSNHEMLQQQQQQGPEAPSMSAATVAAFSSEGAELGAHVAAACLGVGGSHLPPVPQVSGLAPAPAAAVTAAAEPHEVAAAAAAGDEGTQAAEPQIPPLPLPPSAGEHAAVYSSQLQQTQQVSQIPDVQHLLQQQHQQWHQQQYSASGSATAVSEANAVPPGLQAAAPALPGTVNAAGHAADHTEGSGVSITSAAAAGSDTAIALAAAAPVPGFATAAVGADSSSADIETVKLILGSLQASGVLQAANVPQPQQQQGTEGGMALAATSAAPPMPVQLHTAKREQHQHELQQQQEQEEMLGQPQQQLQAQVADVTAMLPAAVPSAASEASLQPQQDWQMQQQQWPAEQQQQQQQPWAVSQTVPEMSSPTAPVQVGMGMYPLQQQQQPQQALLAQPQLSTMGLSGLAGQVQPVAGAAFGAGQQVGVLPYGQQVLQQLVYLHAGGQLQLPGAPAVRPMMRQQHMAGTSVQLPQQPWQQQQQYKAPVIQQTVQYQQPLYQQQVLLPQQQASVWLDNAAGANPSQAAPPQTAASNAAGQLPPVACQLLPAHVYDMLHQLVQQRPGCASFLQDVQGLGVLAGSGPYVQQHVVQQLWSLPEPPMGVPGPPGFLQAICAGAAAITGMA